MSYNFRNLIVEGGGVKSIAYLGALEVLEEKEILSRIERIGGTSVGAINAILLVLGYDRVTTRQKKWSLDFNKFMDDSPGVASDINRLINGFGWHKEDYFRGWIGSIIKDKTGNSESTFADLEAMKNADNGFKSLYFIGTGLSTTSSEVFSAEHTPRLCVSDAHSVHEVVADKLNVVLIEVVRCFVWLAQISKIIKPKVVMLIANKYWLRNTNELQNTCNQEFGLAGRNKPLLSKGGDK